MTTIPRSTYKMSTYKCQIKFDHEPYYKMMILMTDWMAVNLEGWYYDDTIGNHRIFFTSEEDKVMFILRWM